MAYTVRIFNRFKKDFRRCIKRGFQYKCDEFYHPETDGGVSILDDSLGIDWHIPTDKAILSEKDTRHVLLKDFDSPF